jgi:hypothetical protein
MRSAEGWKGAAEREDVRERMEALESIGGSAADAFERVWVIVPPTGRGPVEVSYGSF